MGLQSAINSGLSGLIAYGNSMSVLGNNLSNSSTIGYKSSRTIFSDVLSEQISSASGNDQIGRGVNTYTVDSMFSQGKLESTNSPTDLAISGTGFFTVRDPGGETGSEFYTRAGSFSFNDQGYMVNPSGYRVQGYQLNENNQAIGTIQDIQVGADMLSPAKATSAADISLNLNADSNVFAASFTAAGSIVADTAGNVADETFDLELGGTTTTINTGNFNAGDGAWNTGSAKAIAEEINANVDDVNAYTSTTNFDMGSIVEFNTDVTLANTNLTINGTNIVGDISAANAAEDLKELINSESEATNVTASIENGSLVLKAEDGSNIQLETDGGLDEQVLSNFALNTAQNKTSFGDVTITSNSNDFTISNWTENDDVGIQFEDGTYSVEPFSTEDPGGTSNFSISTEIYDSEGTTHVLSTYFRKTANNEWEYYLTVPGEDVGIEKEVVQVGSGHLSFDEDGKLVQVDGKDIYDEDGKKIEPAPQITTDNIEWANDADSSVIALTPNFTQYDGDSNVSSQSQNGYGIGNLESISVDEEGYLLSSYSNGQTLYLARLGLANFENQQGLEKIGNSMYRETLESGEATLGMAGNGSFGSIFSNTLEGSNVEIAEEFTKMIVNQRAFQANARTITTTDDMLNEVINLKR